MKKVLSLVLVIAMVLSSMSFAFASPLTDIADNDYEGAINTLVGLGVIDGFEDGTFRPEATVTRAQMAKMLVITLGYGDLVTGSKSNFADTQGHWADAYIALAAGQGLVVGYPNGTFQPDKTVSYDEAMTMVVRALGYKDGCNEIVGTWPTNYKIKAAQLGLTDDVKLLATGADRGGVAQLLKNALEAVLVKVDTDGNVSYVKDAANVNKKLLSRLASDKTFTVTVSHLDADHNDYKGNIVDLAPYMFQEIVAYENKDGDVVYVDDVNSLVIEGAVDEFITATNTLAIEDNNGKIQKITFAAATTALNKTIVFENGDLRTSNRPLNATIENAETIKVVANDKVGTGLPGNGNGKIEEAEILGFVITEQTQVARVEKEYITGKTKIDVFNLPKDDNKADLANITVAGDATALEDIKEDDVVVSYASEDGGKIKLVVTRNVVKGEVTRIDGTNYYVDGTKYSSNGVAVLDLGDEGEFFLDHNGKIVDFEGTSVGPTNYAVVVGNADGEIEVNKFNPAKFSIDKYPQLKLATQGNETLVYDVYVKINETGGTIKESATIKVGTAPVIDLVTKNVNKLEMKNADVKVNEVVKYSLNSDGKINKIEAVNGALPVAGVDTTKSTFKVISNVVIFDASDDFAIVNVDRLKDTVKGTVEYNSDGQIKVLVTSDVKAGAATTFALITNVNKAYNSNKDEVQLATVYMNGQKVERFTDDDDDITLAPTDRTNVFMLDLDGDVIKKANAPNPAVVTTTASAVSVKSNMIKVKIATVDTWLALAEDATIVEYKTADDKVTVADLIDIDEATTTFDYYVNEDGDIAFIVIVLP